MTDKEEAVFGLVYAELQNPTTPVDSTATLPLDHESVKLELVQLAARAIRNLNLLSEWLS